MDSSSSSKSSAHAAGESRLRSAGGDCGGSAEPSLEQATLAFIDLETTGLDAAHDRVVQICVERTRGGALEDRLVTFVRSDRTGGQEIHGIAPAQTAGAPTFSELADRVLELLRGAILVAHGAPQDLAFLHHEFARTGRAWSAPQSVDTVALARRVLPAGRHSLVALSEFLGIANPHPHRADNDVRVLRELFDWLSAELSVRRPSELLGLQSASAQSLEAHLTRAEEALRRGQPVRIRYRPSGRAAESMLFCVTAVLRELDPPRVLGYLHRTRGRRQLHGNRILGIEPVGRE